ncbi:MAG: MbnP family protein [Myxococcota bacterium]|nr:MbnP family protein [Myxococcota bacterium]
MTVLSCWPLLFLGLFLTLACSDSDSGGSAAGTVELRISVQSDGEPLVYNEIRYQNAAGNFYSVTEFNFLMTEIALSGSGGAVTLSEAIGWQSITPTESYTFENVSVGDFDTLRFEWGAAGGLNEDGALPDGIIDSWPSNLGGGYHAMQFEGDWNLNGSSTGEAFVMHSGHLRRCRNMEVGYDECEEVDRINQTGMAGVSVTGFSLSVDPNQTTTLELVIDVNGWMTNPRYDLSADWADQSLCPPMFGAVCTLAKPTMSGPQPQQMMQENASNVFSVGSVGQD